MASSGEEALPLIAEIELLDGLYTDIQLSGQVNGWEVGAALRRKWPTKPIVFASSRDWPDVQFPPSGVFMRKPVDMRRSIAALSPH